MAAILKNGRHLVFSNGQSGRFDQKALQNRNAKFDACIIICTIFLLSTTLMHHVLQRFTGVVLTHGIKEKYCNAISFSFRVLLYVLL